MDAYKNFAYSLVATAPSPATTGTSLVVTAADGTKFPEVPFNATIWATGANPITTNAEIVRVTAIATDTLTIVRAQEGSSARTVVVGDQIAATITAKVFTDILGYSLQFVTQSITSPADATTYYYGNNAGVPISVNSGRTRVYVPKAGTLKVAYIDTYASTAGSNEQIDIYVLINNATSVLIASVSAATNIRLFSNTGLSQALAVGDALEIKIVCPTWATNPSSWAFSGVIYIE